MANSSAGRPVAACGGGGQQAEAVQRLGRRQHGVLLGVGATPDREVDQPAQHVHEQPGQRQVGPVGIGGDVEQHDAAGAARAPAVTSGVPSASAAQVGCARSRRGLGQHLAVHLHLVGHRQAGERRAGGERRQRRPAGSRTARRRAGGRRPAARTGSSGSVSPSRLPRPCAGRRSGSAGRPAPPSRPARRAPRPPAAAGRPAPAPTDRACSRVARSPSRSSVIRRQRAAQVVERPGERRVGGWPGRRPAARPAAAASARPAARRSRPTAGLPAPAGSAGCAVPAAA